jgi:EAL domain-containing protein (putative c-di-GMP-specific phosphodiesterase class I)
MQLIRGIDSDPYKSEVVSNLIACASKLQIKVIAEDIETVGEWNWAATHGADYCQGYLFGKPSAQPQPSCATECCIESAAARKKTAGPFSTEPAASYCTAASR